MTSKPSFLIGLYQSFWKALFPMKLLYAMIRIPPWVDKRIKYLIQEGTSLPETLRITTKTLKWLFVLTTLMAIWLYWLILQGKIFTLKLLKSFKILKEALKRSLFKIFLNNNNIRIIPPVYHKNDYVTHFKKNVELFKLFSSQ